jgi:hypothetical protein
MGKTLPPFSSLVEQERRRGVPFKKALPKADQPIWVFVTFGEAVIPRVERLNSGVHLRRGMIEQQV